MVYEALLVLLGACSVLVMCCLAIAAWSDKRLGRREEQRLICFKACRIGIYAVMSLGQVVFIGTSISVHGLPDPQGLRGMAMRMLPMAMSFAPWTMALVRSELACGKSSMAIYARLACTIYSNTFELLPDP